MKLVQVLGTGCAKCAKVKEHADAAIEQLGGQVWQYYPAQADGAFYDAVVQIDAHKERINMFLRRLPVNAHRILAYDFRRRMHQSIGQSAVCGEQQQSRCRHVEPPDSDPP